MTLVCPGRIAVRVRGRCCHTPCMKEHSSPANRDQHHVGMMFPDRLPATLAVTDEITSRLCHASSFVDWDERLNGPRMKQLDERI